MKAAIRDGLYATPVYLLGSEGGGEGPEPEPADFRNLKSSSSPASKPATRNPQPATEELLYL